MQVETASKSEFAGLAKVSPGRVTQWITEGKITPAEMEGEGRNARIKIAPAMEKLKIRLDNGQRNGNGLGTNLTPPAQAASESAPKSSETEAGPIDAIDLAIKKEKLAAAQAQNRKLDEEERARAGQYVLARHASAEAGKIASGILQMFESGLSEIAAEIAAEHHLPQRDILHFLKKRFREIRAKVSMDLADEAEELAPIVEDDEGV